MRNLIAMRDAYIVAMLWADLRDDDGEPLDGYSVSDLALKTLQEAEATCAGFLVDTVAIDTSAWTDAQLGHDLWLTRNRHGTGFWDRGYEPAGVGELLSKIARSYGEQTPYVGDDGLIYTD